jgi:uncharacterized protein (DUF2336 family)
MTDSAAWQSGNAGFATDGGTPSEAKSMISANSFRALTEKLKKPGSAAPAFVPAFVPGPVVQPAQQNISIPDSVPEVLPKILPEILPEILVTAPSAHSRLVETVVLHPEAAHVALPQIEIAAPVIDAPTLAPIHTSVTAPDFADANAFAPSVRVPAAPPAQNHPVASTFRVEPQKPIQSAALFQDDDDVEVAVLENMAERANVPLIVAEPEIVIIDALPEISAPISSIEEKFIPIDSPAQPKIDPADVRRREATFAELDLIARMVYSKPTVDDRIQYLREVSELDEAEKFASQPLSTTTEPKAQTVDAQIALAPVPVLPPEQFQADTAEEIPFLSDDLAAGFDPEEHKKAELILAPDVMPDFQTIEAPPVVGQTAKVEQTSRLLPKVAASLPVAAGSGDVEAHGQLMNDQEAGELARTLLDMMASSTSGGLPQERALAADTLLRLYPRVPVKPLMMLSERLAIMDNPPNLLVGKVIRDPRIEIAGPLLENSPHVADQELLDVIAENDPAKLRLIARRRKLTRAISDRLVQVNDPSVHLTLVRNASAEISHNGYLALTEAARTETDIMAPLTTRADISPPFAFELFWMAPSQLRRYILNRFLTDSETLNKILKITMATQGQTEIVGDGNPVIASVLEALQLAMAGKLPEAAEMMSQPVRISTAAAERILGDQLGEPLAVMLKAIGFPRNDLVQLLTMLQSSELGLIDRDRDMEELLSIFDKLSFNKARILLTYWDWAATRSGPYAPIH